MEKNQVEKVAEQIFLVDVQVNAETKKNNKKMRCLRCNSLVLEMDVAVYRENESPIEIPSMKKKQDLVMNSKSNDAIIISESSSRFWLLNDMLQFENIGFTNTVDKKKYLICADCEIGPLGFQNLDKPNEFLVCVERVRYC